MHLLLPVQGLVVQAQPGAHRILQIRLSQVVLDPRILYDLVGGCV